MLENIQADPLSKIRWQTCNETSLHDSHTEKYYRCAYGYIESFLSHGPVVSVIWPHSV